MKIPHHTIADGVISWLPIAFAITALAGLVYVTVQQSYRQGANDPQIQLAQDISAALTAGTDPKAIVPNGQFEMSKSLSPFVIILDGKNNVVASNVVLSGKVPTPPAGVLDVARSKGENRLTWQPAAGVRNATVVELVPNHGGEVVLVGRSLKEVEDRIGQTQDMAMGVWIIAMIGTLILKVAVTSLI